jgi:hypothetical protein
MNPKTFFKNLWALTTPTLDNKRGETYIAALGPYEVLRLSKHLLLSKFGAILFGGQLLIATGITYLLETNGLHGGLACFELTFAIAVIVLLSSASASQINLRNQNPRSTLKIIDEEITINGYSPDPRTLAMLESKLYIKQYASPDSEFTGNLHKPLTFRQRFSLKKAALLIGEIDRLVAVAHKAQEANIDEERKTRLHIAIERKKSELKTKIQNILNNIEETRQREQKKQHSELQKEIHAVEKELGINPTKNPASPEEVDPPTHPLQTGKQTQQ